MWLSIISPSDYHFWPIPPIAMDLHIFYIYLQSLAYTLHCHGLAYAVTFTFGLYLHTCYCHELVHDFDIRIFFVYHN